jgi:hypothetical protein
VQVFLYRIAVERSQSIDTLLSIFIYLRRFTMNFNMTKIAALAALAFASTGAQAVLTSANTLSIQNDAVTTNIGSATTPNWVVSSDGPLMDSFFTMGGVKTKGTIDTQFAYMYNGANLTLTGATQASVNTWTYYSSPTGSNYTAGTGISIVAGSAIGDVAKVVMSGWKVDWNGIVGIPMGNAAWGWGSAALNTAHNGIGEITCALGSGCAVGSAYTLAYTATVPVGDPSGFGNVKYYAELHGLVAAAVPEASTYGMMLAGLGLVGFAVRRRKQVF